MSKPSQPWFIHKFQNGIYVKPPRREWGRQRANGVAWGLRLIHGANGWVYVVTNSDREPAIPEKVE